MCAQYPEAALEGRTVREGRGSGLRRPGEGREEGMEGGGREEAPGLGTGVAGLAGAGCEGRLREAASGLAEPAVLGLQRAGSASALLLQLPRKINDFSSMVYLWKAIF